jgi:hypothetical protein
MTPQFLAASAPLCLLVCLFVLPQLRGFCKFLNAHSQLALTHVHHHPPEIASATFVHLHFFNFFSISLLIIFHFPG